MANHVINGTINIDWFGDRDKYEKSPLKVITVGLNPSDREFSDATHPLPNVSLRFGNIPSSQIPVHPKKGFFPKAWNNYFNYNPLDWFASFEHVLRGLGASYGGKMPDKKEEKVSCTAIHTDLCTPWATNPTWSKLPPSDKIALTNNYSFVEWKNLVANLKPDIIIACVPQDYRVKLMEHNSPKDIIRIVSTLNGTKRKRPVIIRAYVCLGTLIVFGQTRNVPFGNVSNPTKNRIGQIINDCYQHLKTYGEISSFHTRII